MKGSAAIFIIIGILVAILAVFLFSKGYFNQPQLAAPEPSPTYNSLSEDPKYQDVKQKYNLSEEQLQILSTVNPDDNN